MPIYHTRQRAGPLVKESCAMRPKLSVNDSQWERSEKNKILHAKDSAVCRTVTDRIEQSLALFGYHGWRYELTFDDDHLPQSFDDLRRLLSNFRKRMTRWKGRSDIDYFYWIEGLHGDHRYHIHMVLDYRDFSPPEVEHLWKYGQVNGEPLLRPPHYSYSEIALYAAKERQGLVIPLDKKPWNCSRSLRAKLPAPERWKDNSFGIKIPDGAKIITNTGVFQNEFGTYQYVKYYWPTWETKNVLCL